MSGVSQIVTRCLQPLFDFTSFIQRKYFTLVTFTSTGLSYEYITSALFTHTVHPYDSRLTFFLFTLRPRPRHAFQHQGHGDAGISVVPDARRFRVRRRGGGKRGFAKLCCQDVG